MIRDHSFLQQIFPNFVGQFAKFCGSPWQIFHTAIDFDGLLNPTNVDNKKHVLSKLYKRNMKEQPQMW